MGQHWASLVNSGAMADNLDSTYPEGEVISSAVDSGFQDGDDFHSSDGELTRRGTDDIKGEGSHSAAQEQLNHISVCEVPIHASCSASGSSHVKNSGNSQKLRCSCERRGNWHCSCKDRPSTSGASHGCGQSFSEESESDVRVECLGVAKKCSRVRRTIKTLTSGRRQRSKGKLAKEGVGRKKKHLWSSKLNSKLRGIATRPNETPIPEPTSGRESCICTCYRRTDEHHLGAGVVFVATPPRERRLYHAAGPSHRRSSELWMPVLNNPIIDLSLFNPDDYPVEDCDELARAERAREMAEGVEPPADFRPSSPLSSHCALSTFEDKLPSFLQSRLTLSEPTYSVSPVASVDLTGEAIYQLPQLHSGLSSNASSMGELPVQTVPGSVVLTHGGRHRPVHTQVDYIHCLVPDLMHIIACSFYWGKMDRYEAERLLDKKPEGTFLLRDSAQEEYLFSVSFRRYGRSLHARIEQWNHRFSFDSHDPGVFSSPTVCGLIEHYKDPSCCMFFEPMLTTPLHRNFPFPLQHLCRAVICNKTTYDGISHLRLPKALKSYLREYHYKQRVRIRRFEH